MQLVTNPKTGLSLAFMGGLVISFDIPVIMLAGSDPWLMMCVRGFGIFFVCLCIYLLERGRVMQITQSPAKPWRNWRWLEVGCLYGVNTVLFAVAVYSTTPANLVFILAFNPMIAALLSWWLIGEKPRLVTWLAIFFTTFGVLVIVRDGLDGGTGQGDLVAFACAFILALALVRTRQSGLDMSLAPGFGGLLAAVATLPIAMFVSQAPQSTGWVLANAFILIPLASILLAVAPRFLPAPQVAMFYLVETVMAPVWVWMVFDDVPSKGTMIGGTIVLVTLFVHSAWQARRPAKTREI